MLTFISDKFSRRLIEPPHEPRAALFVNRFTRTATIMYATSGVMEILGLSPRQLISKSFFYCIQEQCLSDAVRCIEGAKSNDSIAYLRFWFRNPLQDDDVHMGGFGNTPSSGTTGPYGSIPPIELEAVVSCTSDGLVVILRRARAPIPTTPLPPQPVPVYANGLFAAPWALEPVFSYGTPSHSRDNAIPRVPYPEEKTTLCRDDTFSSESVPTPRTTDTAYNSTSSSQPQFKESGDGGPSAHDLMNTIRDVAVFAWGIVGINRSLEKYKCGTPTGDAQPADLSSDVKMKEDWDDAAAGRS